LLEGYNMTNVCSPVEGVRHYGGGVLGSGDSVTKTRRFQGDEVEEASARVIPRTAQQHWAA
jgi:hypothetical protein